MYDIAIIGLGPAGATIARLLEPSKKVIAIDRKGGEKGVFSKPCGGLLAPDAQKALSRFNLTLPKEVLVDPQIFAVKTMDLKQNLMRYYRRFYLNLDRRKFDRWLISLIPGGVEIATEACCQTIKKAGELYEITYTQGETERTITARHIIGADGSDSTVRKILFPGKKIRQYLAIQQWFAEKHQVPFYACLFDRKITDCYCWSISKDGYFILGGAFPRKAGKERFTLLKNKLGDGFTFGEAVKTEACPVSRPRGLREFCTAREGAFLIGEAAGFISPSSLEGISYALHSARVLAEVLNSNCKNPARKYRLKTFPIKIKLVLKNLKTPFMYHPLLRKIVMKTGIGTVKVVAR